MKTLNWKPGDAIDSIIAKANNQEYMIYKGTSMWVLTVNGHPHVMGTKTLCKAAAQDHLRMSDMPGLLKELQIAVQTENKSELLKLYSQLEKVDWDAQPNYLFDEYDELVSQANDILLV